MIKKRVTAWLKKGCDIIDGISLYKKYGDNPVFLDHLQLNPEGNRDMLEYQLIKLAKIPEKEARKFKKKVNEKVSKKTPAGKNGKNKKSSDTSVPSSKQEAKTKTPGRKNNKGGGTKTKTFRADWPFLRETSCPPELKIIAADKITAWQKYTSLHKKLFDVKDNSSATEIARELIQAYKENLLILKELDYYKKNKKIYGMHPVFADYKNLERLKNLSVLDLTKQKQKLEHNIWRIQSEIKKKNKPHLRQEREERLNQRQKELAEVKRLLHIDE